MKTDLKAVLFDLDGTLVDTAKDFIYIIKEIADKYNLICPEEHTIREQVSAGSLAMVSLFTQSNAGNNLTQEVLLQYRQEFLDKYKENICVQSELYLGIDELLTNLEKHNIPWGIVTNKPRILAEKLLTSLSLNTRCSTLICPDDVQKSKPDPEPMLLALDQLNIPYENARQVFYIGDHIRDIKAGSEAHMQTIIAGYGYIKLSEISNLDTWGADLIVHSSLELFTLLQKKLMCNNIIIE